MEAFRRDPTCSWQKGSTRVEPVLTRIAQAVDWCVEGGADIISLVWAEIKARASWAYLGRARVVSSGCLDNGVFVVAAAGDDGTNDDSDVASPVCIRCYLRGWRK